VVALESAFISHGFTYPQNRDIALASQAAVREVGALPATVAIHDGELVVGLSPDEVDELAASRDVVKAARPKLAYALARGGWGSTTVSSTMMAAAAAGIRVFAVGGIGGIHRGALGSPAGGHPTLDISCDLNELARTPVVVVCAGPKSILDVGLTIEALETRGVPVLTIGSERLAGYWALESGVMSPISVPSIDEAARIAITHLSLGPGSGMLVCTQVPSAQALPAELVEREILVASADAQSAGVQGDAVTPWLLDRLAERTGGRTIVATAALIVNNAAVAARLATLIQG
jgi:pseudouridylate synthase